jgi:para-nitrobenzyl esterase
MRGILSFFLTVAMSLVSLSDASPILPRQGNSQTVITLAAGSITGIKVSSKSYKFLGIPYAQPPTGNNRFAAPVPCQAGCLLDPYTPFRAVSNYSIDATAFGDKCLQASGGSEDCLTLNIFTSTVSPLGLRPVMFW